MSLVQTLLDLADELTQPRRHVEHRFYWDKNRNRKQLPIHETIQPGLLHQLHEKATHNSSFLDEVGGGTANKPKSKPPLAIEAYARWQDICAGSLLWCRKLHLPISREGAVNIRTLALAANKLTSDQLNVLLEDMQMWRRWAAVLTGWDNRVYVPDKSCPMCTAFRSIRINTTDGEAFCTQCQNYWTGGDEIVRLGKLCQQKELAVIG